MTFVHFTICQTLLYILIIQSVYMRTRLCDMFTSLFCEPMFVAVVAGHMEHDGDHPTSVSS